MDKDSTQVPDNHALTRKQYMALSPAEKIALYFQSCSALEILKVKGITQILEYVEHRVPQLGWQPREAEGAKQAKLLSSKALPRLLKHLEGEGIHPSTPEGGNGDAATIQGT